METNTTPSYDEDISSNVIEYVLFGILVILCFILVILMVKVLQRYREYGYCIKIENVPTIRRLDSEYNRQTALARIELPPDYQAATLPPPGGGNHDREENQTDQTVVNENERPPSYGTVMKNRFSKHLSRFLTSMRKKNQNNSTESQEGQPQPALVPSAMGEEHV
ncbi:uncharacterized protein LOC117100050 isoform X2 [Anneissia japonica]|uniref:uncharacterized protein LOC117100050 isoform X2 n=1 Tax=Anneissia japonica TaxID=1529436 RepID=UPI001425647C|nr:uncharacterized protein LOC117100050 isoform X2 [Anneissia japonica]XP_033095490.1 uncharacterized protein LOC117100050 isoform X2 [Anneissia japonica]